MNIRNKAIALMSVALLMGSTGIQSASLSQQQALRARAALRNIRSSYQGTAPIPGLSIKQSAGLLSILSIPVTTSLGVCAGGAFAILSGVVLGAVQGDPTAAFLMTVGGSIGIGVIAVPVGKIGGLGVSWWSYFKMRDYLTRRADNNVSNAVDMLTPELREEVKIYVETKLDDGWADRTFYGNEASFDKFKARLFEEENA